MTLYRSLSAVDARPTANEGRQPTIGIVTNNQDPYGRGRIKLLLPALDGAEETPWVRVASPMAGAERGLYLLPEVDDEVVVVFIDGDPDQPVVVGSLWNGQDLPPVGNSEEGNHVRLLRSRSGHEIRLDDTPDGEQIEIVDGGGKSRIRFATASESLQIESSGDIVIRAEGNLVLEANELSVDSQVTTIEAARTATLKGSKVELNP